MIRLVPIILLSLLVSCSMLDLIKPAPGIAVDTEIVARDKAINTEVSGSKKETHNTADTITQTYNSVNRQYPWWIVVLLILGWTLPQPSVMFKSIFKWRPWRRNKS